MNQAEAIVGLIADLYGQLGGLKVELDKVREENETLRTQWVRQATNGGTDDRTE